MEDLHISARATNLQTLGLSGLIAKQSKGPGIPTKQKITLNFKVVPVFLVDCYHTALGCQSSPAGLLSPDAWGRVQACPEDSLTPFPEGSVGPTPAPSLVLASSPP